jgi:hypothetical protein
MALGRVVPILRMFDEALTREFYVDFLGFTVDFEHRFDPNAPLFAQVSKDGCSLQLSAHFGDGTPGSKIRIDCTELDAYQTALLAKAYTYARPGIVEQPWGREMSIGDPSGNTIVLVESAP